jgi:hypothetical protein
VCGVVGAELMLLGFVSLLLNVFQGATQRICVRKGVMDHLLPCPRPGAKTAAHYGAAVFTGVLGSTRRLLAGGGAASSGYCLKKVRVTACVLLWSAAGESFPATGTATDAASLELQLEGKKMVIYGSSVLCRAKSQSSPSKLFISCTYLSLS